VTNSTRDEPHILDFRQELALRPAELPALDFQPADPMDVQHIREVITRKRIERMAEGYRLERERDGRPL
jgi:hypothetical protein